VSKKPSKREEDEVSSTKAVSVTNPAKDYAAATLTAWDSCPPIVKKQLEKLNSEILELKAKLRESDVKLASKKTESEK